MQCSKTKISFLSCQLGFYQNYLKKIANKAQRWFWNKWKQKGMF